MRMPLVELLYGVRAMRLTRPICPKTAARGVRIALRHTYAHLHDGGTPADLKSRIASADEPGASD